MATKISITKSRSGHYTVSAKLQCWSAKRGKLASLWHAQQLSNEVRAEVEAKAAAHYAARAAQ